MNNFTLYTLPRDVHNEVTRQLSDGAERKWITRELTDLELRHLGFDREPAWGDNLGVHVDVVLAERVLPAEVVGLKLAAKVRAIEQAQDRHVGGKERRALREELLHSLIPQAPVRTTRVHLYLTPMLNGDALVCVGTAKPGLAEDVLALLRKEFGSFPAVPADDSVLGLYLTEALIQYNGVRTTPGAQPACPFGIGSRVTLQEPGGKATVRVTHMALDTTEVSEALRNGLRVTQLELASEYGTFELDRNMVVRNLKPADMDDEAAEVLYERWREQANDVLVCGTLRALALQLLAWLADEQPLAPQQAVA